MWPRGGKPAANARRRVVVDFAGDPYAEGRQRSLQGEIASRLQGAGGQPIIGDRGAPNQAFYGYAESPQRFVSAAPALATRSAAGTFHDAAPTIETGGDDNPYADPAARIFAARLNRRT